MAAASSARRGVRGGSRLAPTPSAACELPRRRRMAAIVYELTVLCGARGRPFTARRVTCGSELGSAGRGGDKPQPAVGARVAVARDPEEPAGSGSV